MFEYRLEHLMSYAVRFTRPVIMGPVAEGVIADFRLLGGEATGPKIIGKIREVGGDCLTVRHDGIGLIDVRGSIETHDGAVIYISFNGTIDFGEGGYERFRQGYPPPSGTPLHTSPRLHTEHPGYLWLNRLYCLGIGRAFVERSEIAYDVYEVH